MTLFMSGSIFKAVYLHFRMTCRSWEALTFHYWWMKEDIMPVVKMLHVVYAVAVFDTISHMCFNYCPGCILFPGTNVTMHLKPANWSNRYADHLPGPWAPTTCDLFRYAQTYGLLHAHEQCSFILIIRSYRWLEWHSCSYSCVGLLISAAVRFFMFSYCSCSCSPLQTFIYSQGNL